MNSLEHSQDPEIDSPGCVVALVDDNDNVRQLLRLALETAGYSVVGINTQLDLQRYLARHRPDALVINLQRSEADGLDLLVRMRARHSLDDVPILVLSTVATDEFRAETYLAGADWFGLRPVALVELQTIIG